MARAVVLVSASLWALASAGEEPRQEASAEARAELRSRLEALLDATKTATWVESAWERKGTATRHTRARCAWAAPGRLRMELSAGYGKGAVVVLDGGRVVVRPPGILSVLKRSYAPTDGTVRSLRGATMDRAGFFDDLRLVLAAWESTGVRVTEGEAVLDYRSADGLSTRLWLELETLVPRRIESSEAGEVVVRASYDEVKLNPPLAPATFEP